VDALRQLGYFIEAVYNRKRIRSSLGYLTPVESEGFSPQLGYVDNYTLNRLPSGYTAGVQYWWWLSTSLPDGSFAQSHYGRSVTFTSANAFSRIMSSSPPNQTLEMIIPSLEVPSQSPPTK
jgi:hypothetical protein